MKKFLPLATFVLAFCAVLAIEVGWQGLRATTTNKIDGQYTLYEEQFLKGQYQSIDGKKIINSKIKSRVVIVNFWASWCMPCMEEMPSLIRLKKKFNDNQLTVLSFNTDEDEQMKNIQKSVKKLNLKNEFVLIADRGTKIAEGYKFTAIPVTIIFQNGKVVLFNNGPMDFDSVELNEKMKKWVAQ